MGKRNKPEWTTASLREVLLDEIELVRANKVSPWRSMALSGLARQVLHSVHLDMMQEARLEAAGKELGTRPQPILLGVSKDEA